MKKILLLLTTTLLAFALTPLEIMQKVQARDSGDNIVSNMTMTLVNKNGSKRIREMKTFFKKDGKDELKINFFISPSDIKNTSFLTYDYDNPSKDDDQWLFLPALSKVKRIPSSDKDSSFMGSDFSYSDMVKPDLNDYTYKMIKESIIKRKTKQGIKKVPVWIIQSTPKSQKTVDETGYKKSILYVRKDIFMPVRAKIYVANSNKIKYMDVKKIEKIEGINIATTTTMMTKQGKKTIHKTILSQRNVKINQNLKKSFFSTRTMKKGL